MTDVSATPSAAWAVISSVSRRSTVLPVAWSYSTQAEVSARITAATAAWRSQRLRRWRGHRTLPMPLQASSVGLLVRQRFPGGATWLALADDFQIREQAFLYLKFSLAAAQGSRHP